MAILSQLLDPNEREVKRHLSVARAINALEPELKELDDAGLRARSDELRERARGEEDLDELLIEAFALCREAGRRTVGLRHFDVQLVGGIVLHQGKIAEMKTGEGKTLVASLALYLNALACKGVHLINQAIVEAIGIDNLMTIIDKPTLESAQAIFDHRDVKMLCVTGGPAVGRHSQAADLARVPGEGGAALAAGQVPDPHRLVARP